MSFVGVRREESWQRVERNVGWGQGGGEKGGGGRQAGMSERYAALHTSLNASIPFANACFSLTFRLQTLAIALYRLFKSSACTREAETGCEFDKPTSNGSTKLS